MTFSHQDLVTSWISGTERKAQMGKTQGFLCGRLLHSPGPQGSWGKGLFDRQQNELLRKQEREDIISDLRQRRPIWKEEIHR